MEADVRAAEAGLTLAGKSKRPDFSLGLMVDGKMKPTMYRPLGTVSLPPWRDIDTLDDLEDFLARQEACVTAPASYAAARACLRRSAAVL